MASLDAEEALLKKKLEDTENLEERREIRKQLRELRNRKFEEEIKKVTANDYRPGRTKTALSNGVDSSLSSIGRKDSVDKKDEGEGEDVYGISHLGTEEELQALLNETPFTETEKRKKIRARIREIRNHKLGLGDPVIVKRSTREERPKETPKVEEKEKEISRIENKYNNRVNEDRKVKEVAKDESIGGNDHSAYSVRSSYRSRQMNEERYGRRSSEHGNSNDTEVSDRVTSTRHKYKRDDEDNDYKRRDRTKENHAKTDEDRQSEDQKDVDMNAGIHSKKETEEVKEEEEEEEEDEEEEEEEETKEEEPDLEDTAINGYGEDRSSSFKDDQENDLDNEEDFDSRSRESSSKNDDLLDKNEEIEDEDVAVDDDYVDNDKAADDEGTMETYDEDGKENEDDLKEEVADVEEDISDPEEEDDIPDDEDQGQVDTDKRDRGYSAEDDDDSYVEDEVGNKDQDTREPESTEKALNSEEYSDEETASEKDDYDYDDDEEERKDRSYQEPASKEDKEIRDYSDDYSEGLSDHTATDEGSSSVSGKKFDDDQDLADYEFDRQSSERKKAGASYIAKVDEVFRQKEPALAEGKSFKELLKKSDRSPMEKTPGGKRGAEQVDFRTVLRSSDKLKKAGEKSGSNVEQVDFRNLLQKKVKTRTLADKDVGAEQVDFRTVLRQASISSEKKEAVAPRKTSSAEQLDFRNVLKKQPSIKSRKLSIEDKNEMIKSIRAGKDITKSDENAPSEKPGRPSLESLRQGGGVGKAKDELNKNLTEDADSGTTQRKAGRPSLDALKQSGELGKTEDKRGVFEKTSKGKKAPASVPPKPSVKAKAQDSDVVENIEPEIIEEPDILEEVEQEPEVRSERENSTEVKEAATSANKPRKSSTEASSKENAARKTSIEISSKENVEKKPPKTSVEVSSNASAERPRSRRRNEDLSKGEAGKEESRTGRVSQEGEEKRSPTKSGDKRARNRRLRQDQNEAVKVQSEEVKNDKEANRTKNTLSKSSSIERVAVVQSTSSRPTVQVILSTKSSTEGGKADDSDDEGIGARRNRRRLVRKESSDEQDGGRVSVRTVSKKEQQTEEKRDTEREDRKGVSSGNSDTSGKPSRVTARRDAGSSPRTKTETEKSKEGEEDPSKARRAKTSSLDAKLAERRRQRAMENREKQQKARNSRKAFRDQLESSAPTTNGSASPSIQRANSNMTKLLHWCQRMTDGYPNVSVTNFTTSWKDGLAFCALLHNFTPEKIPFDDLSSKRPRENFEAAFAAATEEGVPELLEVEDMVRMECPDPKSVITYIHAIYQEFVSNRR